MTREPFKARPTPFPSLMPDTPTNAPSASHSPSEWVSVATVAARLGVSVRSIQRRCHAGKLRARLAPTTSGQQWEINAASLTTSDRNDRDATKETTRATEATRETTPNDRNDATETTATTQTTFAPDTDLAARYTAQLEGENTFLRGVIEQLQRDGAETRQHLKRALELAPKQLTQGTAINGQQRDHNSEADTNSQQGNQGGAIEADGTEADEMSADELLELCRRITR